MCQMKVAILLLVVTGSLAATIASTTSPKKCTINPKLVRCSSAKQGTGACAYDKNKKVLKTYNNMCMACISTGVSFYSEKACPSTAPVSDWKKCAHDGKMMKCKTTGSGVCAKDSQNILRRFENDCLACSKANIVSWKAGYCQATSTSPVACGETRPTVCTEQYTDTCGIFDKTVKCKKAPCGSQFSNECFACGEKSVASYYPGKCKDTTPPTTKVESTTSAKTPTSTSAKPTNSQTTTGQKPTETDAKKPTETTTTEKKTTDCPSLKERPSICTEEMSNTCGLFFGSAVQCIKAPCGQQYSNSCKACADTKIEKFYAGQC